MARRRPNRPKQRKPRSPSSSAPERQAPFFHPESAIRRALQPPSIEALLARQGYGLVAEDGRSLDRFLADAEAGRRSREGAGKHSVAEARRSATWAAFLVAWKKGTELGQEALARAVWKRLPEVKRAALVKSKPQPPRGYSLGSVRKDLRDLQSLAGPRGERVLDRIVIVEPTPRGRR